MLLQISVLVTSCAYVISSGTDIYNTFDGFYPDYNDLGRYGDMVEATIDILPDIADIFEKITRNVKLIEDPLSPDSLINVVMAFLPITRKVLLAVAKAEGTTVHQEDLDRLDEIEAGLPSAIDYIDRLKMVEFHTSTPIFKRIKNTSSSKDNNIISSNAIKTKVLPPWKTSSISSPSSPFFSSTSSSFSSPSLVSSSSPSFSSSSSIKDMLGSSALSSTSLNTASSSSSHPTPDTRGTQEPNVIKNKHTSLTNSNDLHGTEEAAQIGSFLFSPQYLSGLLGQRVLRGVNPVEHEDLFGGSHGSSFVQMPHSQALFIRHPNPRH